MIVKLLSKLNTSGRNAVFYALVAIAVVAMHNWTLHPQLAYLKAVERLNPVVESISKEQKTLEQKVLVRQKMLERMRNEYLDYCEMLYTPEELVCFANDVRNLVHLAGCEVASWEVTQRNSLGRDRTGQNSSQDITCQQIRVEVAGVYDGLLTLLSDLQNDFQGITIKNLQMTQYSNRSGQLRFAFDLELYVIQNKEVLIDETSTEG